jgi:hypothetical protein
MTILRSSSKQIDTSTSGLQEQKDRKSNEPRSARSARAAQFEAQRTFLP